VPDPVTLTDGAGNVYNFTAISDENGDVYTPPTGADIQAAVAAALAAQTRMRRISTGSSAGVALSSTYAVLSVSGLPATRAHLGAVTLWLTAIAGGANSVTWYMSSDAAGNQPITARQTDNIVGQAAATGGVARALGFPLASTGGLVYTWARTNAGTATGVLGVTWEE
jgi:hypothetical protein